MVPLLSRLPASIMATRQVVWDQVRAVSGPQQVGGLGTLAVVTSLALVALELCFVLFDLVNLAGTTMYARWQRCMPSRRHPVRRMRQMPQAVGARDDATRQQDLAWLSRFVADLVQAGETDLEIQDHLV